MAFKKRPLISVLVPVYNTESEILIQCIESVLAQSYKKWELCIVDDASTAGDIRRILSEYAARDRRIKLMFSSENRGIADTINAAGRLAKGEFLGVLDHDDMLAPMALYEYVKLINERPDADLIYCDEDKINEAGVHCDPWFKSDWNPDLSLSFNYVMHFAVYRRRLFEKLGGVRKAFEGSQDYDLLLRASESSNRIYHIPSILYHWRMGAGSIASGPGAKPNVFVTGLAALEEALHRRRIAGVAEDAPEAWKGVYRVKRKIDRSLTVSILIFYKGDRAGLYRLLDSIEENISSESRQVLVCGRDAILLEIRENLNKAYGHIQWISVDGANIVKAFNAGAKQAVGDLLFFLTDDFELLDGESYFGLVEQAQREEVGAAGGRVYYANGLLEHGGVILGPFDILGYAHRATPDTPGYAGLKHMIGNFSAVMGFGLMTRRALFVEIGGFDAEFNTAYWDADYCLRLGELGYRITYTPYSRLKHNIPVPPLSEMVVEPDATRFRNRWRKMIDRDPYYNPNFSRQLESFEY